MHGWHQNILHVDLTTRSIRAEEPERALLRRTIGGRGLAGHYLSPFATRQWDDPALPLCIMTGPLTGTVAPTSGRCCVMSRSPLTGAVAVSTVGGRLGTQLKRAGWDGVVITGKSDTPVVLTVTDTSVQISDAQDLAGATTDQVFDVLLRHQPKSSVACIGPAGEAGVRFASLAVDRHHGAARAGLGAVCGAKGLKAIQVFGTGRIPVADKPALLQARESIIRLTNASPVLMGKQGFAQFGTAALFDLADGRSMTPTDNFRATRFSQAQNLNAYAFRERYQSEGHGCTGCHILCKKVARALRPGQSMPEYDALSHFTALVGNTHMDTVMEAGRLCGMYGMDPVSAAATLAYHAELTGETHTPEQLLELLHHMGRGTGIGHELAMGSRHYAEDEAGTSGIAAGASGPEAETSEPEADAPGSEAEISGTARTTSMSVKGLELPAWDPRGACGMALSYVTSTRGGCHAQGGALSHEILRKPVATDRFSFSGKARIIKIAEDQNAVVDSLMACRFIFFAATLEEYTKAFCAATGEDASGQELMRAGERIFYRERMMNWRNGFSAQDDDLPERFFAEAGTPLPGLDVAPLSRADFLEARARYYRVRGLDKEGGPTWEKLRELGLEGEPGASKAMHTNEALRAQDARPCIDSSSRTDASPHRDEAPHADDEKPSRCGR